MPSICYAIDAGVAQIINAATDRRNLLQRGLRRLCVIYLRRGRCVFIGVT